ncbi:GNAT family N-acetyltransferase [Priestia megaterium]|uniref:GNAT family N-acetyltransferase n=1 Tax=Priestia megaterium TaxID=1404 RepID=UPI0020420704|nr:GNAT family N-acetyltransferase [Priestia megaterium]MCM3308588.1 GNAT family N-acetyltransferase [Priestia megaterium]
MYLRRRIPYVDDSSLINLAVSTFNIESTMFRNILKRANEVIVICNNDDEIIGFLCYRFVLKDIVFIEFVILDRNYQGKGIAHSFLPDMIKYANKQGIKGVFGYVSKNNSKALKIFEGWGFRQIINSSNGILIGRHI